MAKTRLAASTGNKDPQNYNLYRSPDPFGYSIDGYRSCHCSGTSLIYIYIVDVGPRESPEIERRPEVLSTSRLGRGPEGILIDYYR